MDAANILKPALSSGELRVIGSTTYKEYQSSFEKDKAFSRRFQKVDVCELTVEETVKWLVKKGEKVGTKFRPKFSLTILSLK